MKPWTDTLKEAWLPGMIAGLVSGLVLVVGGRRDTGHAPAAVNAPSQWLWGEKALHKNHSSAKYTATGMAIHQASSLLWAFVNQLLLGRTAASRPGRSLGTAALTTAMAAWVDLRVVPERLSPGFQHRLSRDNLVLVYVLFALGLALGNTLNQRHTPPRPGAE